MNSLDQLDLPELPLDDPSLARDPWPRFAQARQQHPWLAKFTHGYIVHEHRAISELLLMDDNMRTAHEEVVEFMGARGTPWGRMVEEQILNQSGATHKRLRTILAPTFTARNANGHRALMREVISGLLDEWTPRRTFNFEEFVSYYPITVLCRIIGADPAAVAGIRWSLETIGVGMSMDQAILPSLEKAVVHLEEFLRQLVAERRANRRPGNQPNLLDQLLTANEGDGLSERELLDILIVLFSAGYDTSKNMLTMMMHTMLDHPDDYVRCAEDFKYCGRAVEESLRYHNPATIPRLTTRDFTYRDVLIPKGTALFFPVSVAGHDPGAYRDAGSFEPERHQEHRHLAFGRGMHMCLGQHIARAQIEEGWHLITQRIRNPRICGPVGSRPFLGVWGIRGLPIEFEPAARTEVMQ